jgi:hypothetical protein
VLIGLVHFRYWLAELNRVFSLTGLKRTQVKTLLARIQVAFVGCHGNPVYRAVTWIPICVSVTWSPKFTTCGMFPWKAPTSTNDEAPHYAVFSTLPTFHPSLVQISTSAPCSHAPSAYVPPSLSETSFRTHTKSQAKLYSCMAFMDSEIINSVCCITFIGRYRNSVNLLAHAVRC